MSETVQMTTGVTGPDAPEETASGAPSRPEGIPEKFWDAEKGSVRVEDLVKSYKELESQRGKAPGDENTSTSESEGEEPSTKEETQEETTEEEVTAHLPENMVKFSEEFAEKGELSEASYTELAEMGFSKDVVDAYIDGVNARAGTTAPDEVMVTSLKESVGGDEKYSELVEWAKANMSPEQLQAYDAAVSSRNTAQMAVEWLAAQHKASEGFTPKVKIEGKSNAGPTGERYNSINELLADQKDPRYKSGDKAFHAMVDRKLANSNIF